MAKLLSPAGDGVLEGACGSLLIVVMAGGLASPKKTVLWGLEELWALANPVPI